MAPIKIKRGSFTVTIYDMPVNGRSSYVLCYYLAGKRVRHRMPKDSTLEQARLKADATARQLSSGEIGPLQLTNADASSFARARQILAPFGVELENVCAEWVRSAKALGRVPLSSAVDYYVATHPANLKTSTVSTLVEMFLDAKARNGASAMYLQGLRYRLRQFAAAFQGQLADATGTAVGAWLDSLNLGPRSRRNTLLTLRTFAGWAKANGYLPRDWAELDGIPVPRIVRQDASVFTATELYRLLSNAKPDFVPFIALGAFAGLRHAEILRLDWHDVDFEGGWIKVGAAKSKTASRRLVPILPPLRAWLLPLRRASGLVVRYRNAASEVCKLVRLSGVPWRRNALRHSFISYRLASIQNVNQVALEAGNSAAMVFSNYRELVTPSQANQWFGVLPGGAELAQKVAQFPQLVGA